MSDKPRMLHEHHRSHALSNTFVWGRVTLHLDDPDFANGFQAGRVLYFETCAAIDPEQTCTLHARDVCAQLAWEDVGEWTMGKDVQGEPVFYIGALSGYLSGPLLPETEEERARRERKVPRS